MKELLIFLLLLFIENKTISATFRSIRRVAYYSPCPKGDIPFIGKCKKIKEICNGGKFVKNECICPSGKKLINHKCENLKKQK